jgi:hypothetical protein
MAHDLAARSDSIEIDFALEANVLFGRRPAGTRRPNGGECIMVAETVAPAFARSVPRPLVLIAIPLGFAVLGYVLRFFAFLHAGWSPSFWNYPDGLCRWDCLWYVTLAETGYNHFPAESLLDTANWAFFPLLPMLVGGLHALTGWVTIRIATGLSIGFSVLAVLAAWPLLERNIRAYTLYAAFLLCGPFSVYFTTFYTEVLFVLLTNCLLLALRRSNYLLSGVAAGLLSATRIVGVFAVFAIVAQYLVDFRRRGGAWQSLPAEIWRDPSILLAALLAPAGTFAYMAYLYHHMGDALAFSHVQRAWGRITGNPLVFLWQGLMATSNDGTWPAVDQWLAVAAVAGLGLTILLAWRRRYSEAIFCAICLIAPMGAGLASMLRFVVALSPLVLLAIELLARRKPLFVAATIGFAVADYFFTVGWLQNWLPLV